MTTGRDAVALTDAGPTDDSDGEPLTDAVPDEDDDDGTPDARATDPAAHLDTETHRATVDLLPDEIAYLQLDTLRERRLTAAKVYQEVQEMKKKARSERVREMLTKQLAIYDKKFVSATKALDDMELRANKIRALRLELDALT